jgi:hypothetical protein
MMGSSFRKREAAVIAFPPEFSESYLNFQGPCRCA